MAPFTARGNTLAIASEDAVLTIDTKTGVTKHALFPPNAPIQQTQNSENTKPETKIDDNKVTKDKNTEIKDDSPETKHEKIEKEDNQEDIKEDKPKQNSEDYSHLNVGSCVTLSPCGTLLAVCTPEKNLTVWNIPSLDLKKQWKTARKVSSLAFNSDSSQLFVADKAGDCFCYSLNSTDDQGKVILGHLSMLLDVVISHDDKFILTSERDEKIRVSCLPNAYNIHAYCLGHTEFVSSLNFIHQNLLLSGSGDGTLRVWDYLTGKMLHKENLKDASDDEMEKAIRSVKVFRATTTTTVAAVLLDRVPNVLVFKITGEEPTFNCQTLPFTSQPLEIAFTDDGSLYVLTDSSSSPIEFFAKDGTFQYTLEESHVVSAVLVNTEHRKIVQDCVYSCNGDLKPLFKRWFDNVQLYRERKQGQKQGQKLKEKSANSDSASDPKRVRID